MKTPNWPALMLLYPELRFVPEQLRVPARHLDKSEHTNLFMTGDRPGGMFYVLTGEVRLFRTAKTGEQIILQRALHGFVAEASLQSSRYHCDGGAAVASTLLKFPITDFRQALKDDPTFQSFWIDRLTRELRKVRAQCERLSLNSAQDRILHFVESEGSGGVLKLHQTRKAWASELGLTHETLYRTLRQLVARRTLTIQTEGGVTTISIGSANQ